MKTCTHKDCSLKHFAKGFCRKHHARLVRNGSPNGIYNKDGYSDLRGVKDERPGARGYLAINLINDIKYKAKQRGIEWSLTHAEAFKLIISPCSYCDFKPNWPLTRVGIDRIDSNTHYVMSNCVSCCFRCNSAKNDMTLIDFKSHVENMYNHLFKKTPKL